LKTIFALMVISLFAAPAARAQMLVDPAKVAPEYREAAEKRRAEQLRQRECVRRADADKILVRDRTAYLNQCLETMVAKQAEVTKQ
jgi:glycine/D-amino acid oxidase-like deaminating enzyme